jgi:DNA-binding response OmpR family regulator
MPGKGGYWLIGEVRALPTDRGGATPAAALTAYVGEPHRTSVLRAGFQCHVEKPVRVAELIDVVSRLATKRDPAADAVKRQVNRDDSDPLAHAPLDRHLESETGGRHDC